MYSSIGIFIVDTIMISFFRNEAYISDKPAFMSTPRVRYMVYAATAVLLSAFQVIFVSFIAIEGVTPDLVLIWCIWVALYEGQLVGMVVGFGTGLVFDAIASAVLGSNALAKVIASFIAGYFYKEGMERQRTGSWSFILIVTVCGAIHNLIYYFFYLRPTEVNFYTFFLHYGVFTTLYTSVAAIIPKLIASRKQEW